MDERTSQQLHVVSDILWRERDLLDAVAYKLEVERMVLDAGAHRWLPRAARELDAAVDGLRVVELGRAVQVDALAEAIGLDPGPTLAVLAAAVPEPWATILGDHHAAFRSLAAEIRTAVGTNRELLVRGRAATATALAWLAAPEGGPQSHALVDDGRST